MKIGRHRLQNAMWKGQGESGTHDSLKKKLGELGILKNRESAKDDRRETPTIGVRSG